MHASILVLASGACVATTARREEPRVHLTSAGEIRGPYVPAGTVFVVELLGDLSRQSGSFHARLDEGLRAPDGRVIVRRGAMLDGRVERTHDDRPDLLRVDLMTVHTLSGDVPISVARADPAMVSTSPRVLATAAAPAGTKLTLVLTEPFVPAGSSYR